MKIIGLAETGHRSKYLAEVSHEELEMFLDLYYNKLDRLKVGDEVDLSKGRNFYNDTMSALKKTEEFIGANQKVIDTIFTGISLIGRAKE